MKSSLQRRLFCFPMVAHFIRFEGVFVNHLVSFLSHVYIDGQSWAKIDGASYPKLEMK